MSHPNDVPQMFSNTPGMMNDVDPYHNSMRENPAMSMIPNGKIEGAESHMMQPAYPNSFLEGINSGFNPNIVPNSPIKMQNTFSLDFGQVPLMTPMEVAQNTLVDMSQRRDSEEKPSTPEKESSQDGGLRPKRPMNAFLLFSTQRRRELRSQDASITTSELSKILGKEWSELSEEIRRDYQEKASVIKKDFFEKHPDYAYTRKPKKPKAQPQADRIPIAPPAFLFREKPDIKRPMNAYLLFNRQSRPKLLQENPKLTTSELSREIGLRWKAMLFEERQVYVERAAQMRQEFFATHPGHIFTRQTKQEKRELLAYKAIAPSARGRKKRDRNSDAPKHPMSAFLFYLVSNRGPVAEQNSGCPAGPIAKILSVRWKALTPEEKTPWLDMAHKDKERYAKELKIYNDEQAAAKERRKELGLDAVPIPVPMPRPPKAAKVAAKAATKATKTAAPKAPAKPKAKSGNEKVSGIKSDSISDSHASSNPFMAQQVMHDGQYMNQHNSAADSHYMQQSESQYVPQGPSQYAPQPAQYAQQHESQYAMHHEGLYGAQHGTPFGNQNSSHHESQYPDHSVPFSLSHDGSASRNYDINGQPKHQTESAYGLDHQTRGFNLHRPESSDAMHQAAMGHPPSEHDNGPILSHLGSMGLAPDEPAHSVAYMHHSDSGLHHQNFMTYSEPAAMPHSDLHSSSFSMSHHPSFNLGHSSFGMSQPAHVYHPVSQSQASHFDQTQAPHSDLDR